MDARSVMIINQLGLHARAAAKFVQTASAYECNIYVRHNGREVNGKSIMGVMMLAAATGMEIELLADGTDAHQALDALEKLVLDRFGEKR